MALPDRGSRFAFEKLLRMWDQWSWHRVTFYGDVKESVYALAEAAGWKGVEEAD